MAKRLQYYTAQNMMDDLGLNKAIERANNNIIDCRRLGESEEMEYWQDVLHILKLKTKENKNG